jgi:hypothetical protein
MSPNLVSLACHRNTSDEAAAAKRHIEGKMRLTVLPLIPPRSQPLIMGLAYIYVLLYGVSISQGLRTAVQKHIFQSSYKNVAMIPMQRE